MEHKRSGYRNGQLIYPISYQPDAYGKDEGGGGGGGGDSSQPGPNTVGTEEVKDGSLQLRDMNNNIYASSNDIDQIL